MRTSGSSRSAARRDDGTKPSHALSTATSPDPSMGGSRLGTSHPRASVRSPSVRGDEVTETWYPLGYNIRPKRLQAIAREAVASYGGELPSDEATLLSFKGIGAYTAGAIRSFAFRQRAAILDTNVRRVLFRVFIGKGDPKGHAMKRQLWTISEALVPTRHAFDFNQALMDLGAMVCTARKP